MLYINSENLKPETKVFRYMDLAKFLSLIHQKAIFFAKASSYEDSLEGMPTELDNFLGSESAELLDITINSVFSSFALDVGEDARKREQDKIREARLKHENRKVNTVFGLVKVSENFGYTSTIKATSNWVDISCWHTDASDVESMAMWKIYGGGAAAVCIESTVKDVRRAMNFPSGFNMYVGMVSYIDYKKDSIGFDEPIKFFFNKSKYYEFEKELRFVLHPVRVEDFKAPRAQFGTSVAVDPKLLIKGVMVSPAASAWFYDLIELVMKDSGYSVPVSRSKIPLRK